ncbi:hypothetical protein BXZ70DRAFT_909092 [Cristinia sonorae]|uniref:Uncharacterized protein n=1 Tax=Cristinia sonorae TaxID=1940300 RepID=A0A8K0UIB1_9AGAR|nr:hypothetical protein BXZ70DRAFT_909092 [Cristinia sonorae]
MVAAPVFRQERFFFVSLRNRNYIPYAALMPSFVDEDNQDEEMAGPSFSSTRIDTAIEQPLKVDYEPTPLPLDVNHKRDIQLVNDANDWNNHLLKLLHSMHDLLRKSPVTKANPNSNSGPDGPVDGDVNHHFRMAMALPITLTYTTQDDPYAIMIPLMFSHDTRGKFFLTDDDYVSTTATRPEDQLMQCPQKFYEFAHALPSNLVQPSGTENDDPDANTTHSLSLNAKGKQRATDNPPLGEVLGTTLPSTTSRGPSEAAVSAQLTRSTPRTVERELCSSSLSPQGAPDGIKTPLQIPVPVGRDTADRPVEDDINAQSSSSTAALKRPAQAMDLSPPKVLPTGDPKRARTQETLLDLSEMSESDSPQVSKHSLRKAQHSEPSQGLLIRKKENSISYEVIVL